MVAKPGPAADTVPVGLTIATAVLLLLHEPPDVRSVSTVVDPRQMLAAPLIGNGGALTVNKAVDAQPVGKV